MGMIGIAITVLAMAFGAGYFILQTPEADLVVENPAVSPIGASSTEMPVPEPVEEVGKASEEATVETSTPEPVIEEPETAADQPPAKDTKSDVSPPQIAGDDTPAIKDRFVSFGYVQGSGRKIDTAVLHSSYNNQGGDRYSVDRVIDIWKSYDVAPHYMIDRKGTIYRLVEDEDIAYHAGNSKMPDGRTNVNGFSIGVEILGDEDDGYTSAQYAAVNDLVAYLKRKHGVKHVVGHDDIAPGRKTDPWNFDWKKLK